MKAWTDYPFLGTDRSFREAPVRKINIIGWDGDKYVRISSRGLEAWVKSGYIYPTRRRFDCRRKSVDTRKIKLL
jgi:hypothetical protein